MIDFFEDAIVSGFLWLLITALLICLMLFKQSLLRLTGMTQRMWDTAMGIIAACFVIWVIVVIAQTDLG